MDKRQKRILIEFLAVILLTCAAVVAMINFRDWVNRSEATRAMEQLGRIIVQYRKDHGSVPPQSYIDGIRTQLEGHPRLGNLKYRALWIDFESPPDEILAYTRRDFKSWFVDKGYLVLRLDGTVEWLDKQQCEQILARQQTREELEMLNTKQKGPAELDPLP